MMAHAGGRPLKFKSVEELQEKIDAYFIECDPHPIEKIEYIYPEIEVTINEGTDKEKVIKQNDRSKKPSENKYWGISNQKPYTITGLANFLDTSRETLINYEDRTEFFDTIKRAKTMVEEFWENQLLGSNATGPIFNLKNNYGWKDRTEQELSNPDGTLNPYSALKVDELRKLAGE